MLRVIKYRAARPRIQHFITAMAADWPVLQCKFAAKGKSLEIFLCPLPDILLGEKILNFPRVKTNDFVIGIKTPQ
jgi:hypothetical protein